MITTTATTTDPTVTCEYGPVDEIATRLTDSGEALCAGHAREHYGRDWREYTTRLTPRKAAVYLARYAA